MIVRVDLMVVLGDVSRSCPGKSWSTVNISQTWSKEDKAGQLKLTGQIQSIIQMETWRACSCLLASTNAFPKSLLNPTISLGSSKLRLNQLIDSGYQAPILIRLIGDIIGGFLPFLPHIQSPSSALRHIRCLITVMSRPFSAAEVALFFLGLSSVLIFLLLKRWVLPPPPKSSTLKETLPLPLLPSPKSSAPKESAHKELKVIMVKPRISVTLVIKSIGKGEAKATPTTTR